MVTSKGKDRSWSIENKGRIISLACVLTAIWLISILAICNAFSGINVRSGLGAVKFEESFQAGDIRFSLEVEMGPKDALIYALDQADLYIKISTIEFNDDDYNFSTLLLEVLVDQGRVSLIEVGVPFEAIEPLSLLHKGEGVWERTVKITFQIGGMHIVRVHWMFNQPELHGYYNTSQGLPINDWSVKKQLEATAWGFVGIIIPLALTLSIEILVRVSEWDKNSRTKKE